MDEEKILNNEPSEDELEAATGGSRDFAKEGCAATVEFDSHCWGTDGGCTVVNIKYENAPIGFRCSVCGKKQIFIDTKGSTDIMKHVYVCKNCGRIYKFGEHFKLGV